MVTNILFKDQIADTLKQNSQMERVMKNDLSAMSIKWKKFSRPIKL
jgi:hypothetical protein